MPTGVVPGNPPGIGPGDPYHLLFVTSERAFGSSPAIDDYNDFINQAADDEGVGPNDFSKIGQPIDWFAVGSTELVNARDNAVVTAPVCPGG